MARQFDVFTHPVASRREFYPYNIVMQHQGFQLGPDVMAAPLAGLAFAFASRLLPALKIEGRLLNLMTHEMSPVPQRLLKQPLANLEADRRIIATIDLLFVGS